MRSPDCFFEEGGGERRWHGHEGAAEFYRNWWDGFDNEVTTEVRHFPAPDRAIVETRWRGRHHGTFRGIEPTGRAIDVPVLIVVEIRDGLMAGESLYWDRLTLLTQLGVREAPAGW